MREDYFDNFTKEAKDALVVAQEKAQESRLSYVGTEHVMLGILAQKDSLGATILANFGVSTSNVELVLKSVGRSTASTSTPPTEPGSLSGFAKRVIEEAVQCAHKFNHNFIGTEHLLFGVVSQENTAATVILENMKISPKQIQDQILEIFENHVQGKDTPQIPGTETSPGSGPPAGPNGQVNPLEFFLSGLQGVLTGNDNYQDAYKHKSKDGKNSKSKTPTLDYFTFDLNEQVRQGKIDPVIGRADEITRVISILNRKTKNNPVLIGEPGVGKTAVVEGLAAKIVAGDVPETMLDKRILNLSMGTVIAGTKYRGEFEERIKMIIEEAISVPNVILFIDELHTLVGAGSAEGSLDAANILKPALGRGQIQVIGATTTTEYRKSIEEDSALERRFQSIMVDEPSPEEAVEIMLGLREGFEDHHNLMITEDAIRKSVDLSKRYITDRFLPDKAIDLLDEACALKRVNTPTDRSELKKMQQKLAKTIKKKEEAVSGQDYEKAAKLRDNELDIMAKIESLKSARIPRSKRVKVQDEDVAHIIAKMTGIPATKLLSKDIEKLQNLEATLHTRIIGQEKAVVEVAKSIRRSRAGISDHRRPIGSFIFLGPTGVGKTELVKALAEEVYDDAKALIKIDMSEFMERHNTSRLVGATAGYVGYEDGGQLTEAVRRKPYSVVLFDEIEKAHPDVFNLLLQILEDGVLTDSKGKKVDFSNTIIIMTSNIGAEKLNKKAAPLGFNLSSSELKKAENDFEDVREDILHELKKSFRPEFINRVDRIIIFDALTHANVKEIVKLELDRLQERLDSKQIKLNLKQSALEILSKLSYDPEYGARPVRRTIQDLVEDEITEGILSKDILDGAQIDIIKKGDSVGIKVVKPKKNVSTTKTPATKKSKVVNKKNKIPTKKKN